MSYAKLFASLLVSSVWGEPDQTRLVWITLLLMKDADGFVKASVGGLARVARVSEPETRIALQKFMDPDPDSTTPDHEGRRIERVPGGWFILNHEIYRDLENPIEKREKATERQRRKREKDKRKRDARTVRRDSHVSARDVTLCTHESRHTDTDPNVPDTRVPDPDLSPVLSEADPGHGGRGDRVQGADVAQERVASPQRAPIPGGSAMLVNSFLVRLNDARERLAKDFGLTRLRPITLMGGGGSGERELIRRLAESSDPAGDLDHVLTAAIEEATKRRELRWLGWSLAETKAWRAKLAAPIGEATPPTTTGRIEPGTDYPDEDKDF